MNTDQTLFSSSLNFFLYPAPVARFCQPFLHFYRGCVTVDMTNFQHGVTHQTSADTNMFLTPLELKKLLGEERKEEKARKREKERKDREKGMEIKDRKWRRWPACLARHARHHAEHPSEETGKEGMV